MAKLELQGYRGTRDFYPEEFRKREWVYSRLKNTLKSFGYEEYTGPLVEPLELYASKSSEEIVSKQLYSFTDRGERQIAIRPEMTPTLARMVAAKGAGLPKPLRWFSIPQCMRYERPQRGRLREFDQLNVDIFGGTALDEDLEILQLVVRILENLGANPEMYEVKINHRKLLAELLYNHIGIDNKLQRELVREIDRRDKVTPLEFEENLQKLGIPQEKILKLQHYLTNFGASAEENNIPLSSAYLEHWNKLQTMLECLKKLGILNVVFDPTIMRGFDYYTGMVFEVFDKHPLNNRAMFGGGRYDNLVEAFGAEALSGIGFGAGDVPLLNFCEIHGLIPETPKPLDVVVCRFDSDLGRTDALILADLLRTENLCVENALTEAKFGKQIQSAEKRKSKAVAFIGDEEKKSGTFCAKILKTGEQLTFPANREGASLFAKKIH